MRVCGARFLQKLSIVFFLRLDGILSCPRERRTRARKDDNTATGRDLVCVLLAGFDNSKQDLTEQPIQMAGVKVTGITETITEQQLREFFSYSGDVTGVEIFPEGAGRAAIVRFADEGALETALLLSGATIVSGGERLFFCPVLRPSPHFRRNGLPRAKCCCPVRPRECARSPIGNARPCAPTQVWPLFCNLAQEDHADPSRAPLRCCH